MKLARLWVVFVTNAVACTPSMVQEVEGPRYGAMVSAEVAQPVESPSAEDVAEQRRTTPIVIADLPWQPQQTRHRVSQADVLLGNGKGAEALLVLGNDPSPQAALLRARALRMTGNMTEVEEALVGADGDPALAEYVTLERGLLAQARGDSSTAVRALLPLLDNKHPSVAWAAALPLTFALGASDPAKLLEIGTRIEQVLPQDDMDARSLWLEAQAKAATALGKDDMANRLIMRRYIEEPVSRLTPEEPPAGASATPEQLLYRAEKLLDEHRSERVLTAVAVIPDKDLTPELLCRKRFAAGLASRKLRHYGNADQFLGEVVATCESEDLVRRAMYLHAKVVSIKNGLEAMPIIDKFAERFAGHTMVDDVLFWAGDLYQRRQRWKEAATYYGRIEELPEKGDHCGEARWRMAWMAYQRKENNGAKDALRRVLDDDGCVTNRFERARAHYWLGRLSTAAGEQDEAAGEFVRAIDSEPLGYYAQLALGRLQALAPKRAERVIEKLVPPAAGKEPALCPGFLADDPSFDRALLLLVRGLQSDAAAELRAIKVAANVSPSAVESQSTCPRAQSLLLLSLLLDRAGAHRDAHWRLRTDFADTLAEYPNGENGAVWLAAYPLAFREFIEASEKESHLPNLFLQALAREESALDPQVVSWAGAYGLTQLLFESGQRAGKILQPPVVVNTAEDLLEPEVNARLGAALLGSQVKKLGGNLGLALAAYNAGDSVALTWWKRYQNQPFDVFAESITIKETRGYVMRVLTTLGTYRWLYTGELPLLPVGDKLPPRP